MNVKIATAKDEPKLQVLRECKPPWPEADHYSHVAHCKNVEPWW